MQGEKLKYSEHFMKHAGGEAGCGFNARIMGHSHQEAMSQIVHGYGERSHGWHYAHQLARAGKLYAVHNFHNSHECSGHAFPYGGTFVCNTRDRSNLAKDWWAIKCFPMAMPGAVSGLSLKTFKLRTATPSGQPTMRPSRTTET